MHDILQVLLAVVPAIMALIGASYLIGAILHPAFFLDFFSLGASAKGDTFCRRAVFYARAAILVGSVGYFLHGGMAHVVEAIPGNWGDYDEYGDWSSTKDGLHVLLVFYATTAIVTGAERIGEAEGTRRRREREIFRQRAQGFDQ
jgi:hypothetical protein